MNNRHISWSMVAFFASIVVILYSAFMICPRWQRGGSESTLGWDVSGYYWYLPAAFIYHDLKDEHFGDSVISSYHFTPTFEQGFRTENGGYVLTYASGMAVLYSPFFAVAHLLARPLGYPADGFSKPYLFAISMGSLLVCILGLWYYRKLLQYYFSDTVVAIMLLLLVIGTNYLNYTAIDGALTHNWLFTLYVFLMLATRAFYQDYKTKHAVAIGVLCGLLILVRPSEIIALLIPLLWGLESCSSTSLRARIQLFRQQFPKLLLAGLCTLTIGAIQLAYWKYVSGHWLVYSYGDKGFSWKHPHLFAYMLSYRSGWLTYTPLLFLCFAGLIPFLRSGKNKVAILSFFALNLYIVSAWDIWWYGGTGGRAMIQSYPVILFPLAALIEFLLKRKVWLLVSAPFILATVYFNIWFTIEAHGGESLYDSESMTRAYYWRVAGRWHVPPEVKKLKDTDELFEGTPKNLQPIYYNDLEADTSLAARPDAIEGHRSIYLAKEHLGSRKYAFPAPTNGSDWLRMTARFHIDQKEWNTWEMTQFIVGFSYKGQPVKERMIRAQRFLENGDTKDLFVDTKLPKLPYDSCYMQFWSVESEHPVLIDLLRASTFKAD